MKKSVVIFSVMMSYVACLMAGPINPKQAKENATAFAERMKGSSSVILNEVAVPGIDKLAMYNIVGGGYVVASLDDRTRPVLGYDRRGCFTPDDMPEGLQYWLEEYQRQIAQLGDISAQELEMLTLGDAKDGVADSVAPLLVSEWSQYRYGYNSQVPYDSVIAADSNMYYLQGHPTVGCGALAAAQIMRYWRYPEHGNGSHSYTVNTYDCWRYGTLSADFASTTYDFDHMPRKLSDSSTAAEVYAVAQLIAHCGIACNMNYNSDCHGSSGSSINSNLAGLQRYFHYNGDSYIAFKMYNSNTTWTNLLKTDLSNGQPVYYCGQSFRNDNEGTLAGGHAFVCDGYDEDDFFHFDWGWNGSSNGYFSLSVLRPLTQYDFTSYQYCILNLKPSNTPTPIMVLGGDPQMSRTRFCQSDPISGTYRIANIGDSVLNTFVGVNIYGLHDQEYYGCVDGRRVVVNPGDTVECQFSYPLELPLGSYSAVMQCSTDSFYAGITEDLTNYLYDLEFSSQVDFVVASDCRTEYANLAVMVRFADDPEITTPFSAIDDLFNGEENSVKDFFGTISYNQFTFNTIYPQQGGQQIFCYVDSHPRAYYQPYSSENPLGYTIPNPQNGISMREAELIARVCRFVDSLSLVNDEVVLDANGDGNIDNVSFVVQGQPFGWGELLWPHMEYYPHDSVGYDVTINGKRINAFCFEFEGSEQYFTLNTFAHEMGHALGLPDLYHYNHYTDVYPVLYDLMGYVFCQPSAIYKHKFLHLLDDVTEITASGEYTINSVGSSASNSLYYFKSQIDPNQWYTIEYRNNQDPYESGLPRSGLIIGRWMDTATLDYTFGGNQLYDGGAEPNRYYVFRPNSWNDTVNGNYNNCIVDGGPFDQFFTADGVVEQNRPVISNVRTNGTECTFEFGFVQSIDTVAVPIVRLYPSPTSSHIFLEGVQHGTPVAIYNMMGQQVAVYTFVGEKLNVESLKGGIYILLTPTTSIKFIKID